MALDASLAQFATRPLVEGAVIGFFPIGWIRMASAIRAARWVLTTNRAQLPRTVAGEHIALSPSVPSPFIQDVP